MDSTSMIYFLPLIMMLLTMGQAHAYTTQTPEISGFNNRTMKLTGGAGGFSGGTYSRTGTVIINGKTVPIPGSLKPSSGMGNIVKNALKLNPTKIALTLAAAWLIDQGLEWMGDTQGWTKNEEDTIQSNLPGAMTCQQLFGADEPTCQYDNPPYTWSKTHPADLDEGAYGCYFVGSRAASNGSGVVGYAYSCTRPYPTKKVPMTDDDWLALPDPMPFVGDELPTAPYLPDGVTIVEPPAYIPETKTIGAPYTKADGSTAQPMAKITPVGDGQVAIDTYEQPLTNPDGTPVPTGTPPTDTTEQPALPKDPCTENPNRLGCMDAGDDQKDIPTNNVDFTFTPESSPLSAGSCPAPISVLGHTISYQPACDAMGMIRALIIAMSSLTAAYILIGAFKSE